MSNVFDSIMSHGYYTPFGGLTEEQLHCKSFTNENLHAILHVRQREKFVREVQVCCCGYCSSDEDEPMLDSHFSQFQFYKPWIEEIIYFHDKFDFLVKCIANGVCKVEAGFEERYVTAILDVLTFRDTTIPASPQYVLDLRQPVTPRICAEVKKSYEEKMQSVEKFTNKAEDYTGVSAARAELLGLLAEQAEAERRRHLPPLQIVSPPPPPTTENSATAHQDAKKEVTKEEGEAAAAEKRRQDDEALILKYRTNGLDLLAQEENEKTSTPLLHMLMQLQQEEMRQ